MSELIDALQAACRLLETSRESVWSPLSPAEVRANLEAAIGQLRETGSCNTTLLGVEFAPTSTLQEIAMENGWHDEYMKLAEIVDPYLGD